MSPGEKASSKTVSPPCQLFQMLAGPPQIQSQSPPTWLGSRCPSARPVGSQSADFCTSRQTSSGGDRVGRHSFSLEGLSALERNTCGTILKETGLSNDVRFIAKKHQQNDPLNEINFSRCLFGVVQGCSTGEPGGKTKIWKLISCI